MSGKRNIGAASCMAAAIVLSAPAAAQTAADVEALQRQIDALQQQLEALKSQVEATAADAAPAPEGVALSGGDKVTLEISGQVNRGVLFTDDGDSTDVFFVDNDASSTRLRAEGRVQLDETSEIGANIEVQFESNSTADVNQEDQRGAGDNNFTERKLEVFYDSETFGKFSLGQGDTASNGVSEVDLSGSDLIIYSSVADFAGGLRFRDGDALSATTIGDVASNFDGLSRDDRLRYDTPSLAGWKLSASAVADERWDVAARYSRSFGDARLAAAVAYSDIPDSRKTVNGSASILVEGFSLTLAAANADFETASDDGTFYYGKVGYEADFFAFGSTAVAIDYYVGENVDQDGDEIDVYGLGVVQNLSDYGTELYAGYRFYDADREGADFDDIHAVLTGARVKF